MLCSLLHVLYLSSDAILLQADLDYSYVIRVCVPFAGRCEVSRDLSIFFGFLCQRCYHVDRPKTMADGASASSGSDESDETQGILKSMQTMIGAVVQKVSDIENKCEELR